MKITIVLICLNCGAHKNIKIDQSSVDNLENVIHWAKCDKCGEFKMVAE